MSKNEIQVYEDTAGEYRWRMVVCGQILAKSSEGYVNRGDALKMAGRFASIDDESVRDQYTTEAFIDAARELRWRLRADNGNIIACSPKGYTSLKAINKALAAMDRAFGDTTVVDRTGD